MTKRSTFNVELIRNHVTTNERFSSKRQARSVFSILIGLYGSDQANYIGCTKIVSETATGSSRLILAQKEVGSIHATVYPEFFA